MKKYMKVSGNNSGQRAAGDWQQQRSRQVNSVQYPSVLSEFSSGVAVRQATLRRQYSNISVG